MTVRTYTNVTLNTHKQLLHLQTTKNIYKHMTKNLHLLQTSIFLSLFVCLFFLTQKIGMM